MNEVDLGKKLDTITTILKLAHADAIAQTRESVRSEPAKAAILDGASNWTGAGDLVKTVVKKSGKAKEVRELYAHYRAAQQTNGAAAAPVATQAKRKTKSKAAVVSIKGMGPLKLSVITKVHADEAKLMADQIYPRLYLFENSLRD